MAMSVAPAYQILRPPGVQVWTFELGIRRKWRVTANRESIELDWREFVGREEPLGVLREVVTEVVQ